MSAPREEAERIHRQVNLGIRGDPAGRLKQTQ